MSAEEALQYGRSSSRAMRAVKDISATEQRSFFGSKGSKKSQQKTVSDKLVWFSPVHSPLLSPAREKALQITKKKVRQSSIFSIQSRGKGSLEAEEPTSPKVSCIGQVRSHKKDKDPFAEAVKKKNSQSKPGSMSPARFFTSPGRSSKWGSLFGSRKDSGSATPSSSGYGEGDASCFGWPFESRSAFQTDKTCAFLARSLDLFQEGGNLDTAFHGKVTQPCSDAPGYQLKKQGSIRATADGYFDRCTRDEVDPHACTSASNSHSISLMEGASDYEVSGASLVDEKQHGGQKLITNPEAWHHAGSEKSSHEYRRHGKPPASKQRLTYEELPSLHCGASAKQNMKISVEVVPETWLWRNGERLRTGSTSHLNHVSERSVSTSREDSEKAQQDEVNLPVSPCGDAQSYTRVAEEFMDHQVMPVQSQTRELRTAEKHGKSGSSSIDASSIPVEDTADKPINVNEMEKNDADDASATESSQSQSVTSPCCTSEATLKEKSEECKSSLGGYNGAKNGKQQLLSTKPQTEADAEKSCNVLGSFEVKQGHQMVRRIGVDVGKENYSIALPPLRQKNLPSLPPREDGKRSWSIFKSRKIEPFSAQPFSALILVGYDQSAASKDMRCNDEELLKGLLEVGRLSFHGSGNFFQVLNGDAAFNRSRSATSHRTVIRLQRCNSDPCRPSC